MSNSSNFGRWCFLPFPQFQQFILGRRFLPLFVILGILLAFPGAYAIEEYQVGTNATFKCTSPEDKIIWSFNTKNLTNESKDYIIQSEAIPDTDPPEFTHTLTIKKVNITHEGNFTCHTKDNTNSFRLQPVIEPEIVGHNEPSVIRLKQENPANFFCLVRGYPAESIKELIKWEKDETPLQTSESATTSITIVNSTHVNATLDIAQVYKNQNGTYACTISSISSLNVVKQELSLLVLDVPHVSIDFVKAVSSDKIYVNWTVNDGNDQILKYFVQFMEEGKPTFTYYNHVIGGKNLSYVLDNFKNNTNYQLKISAKNSQGDGPQHLYPHWIRTLEYDPVFVPVVETTGNTESTITVGWHPPSLELLEYVHYYELIVTKAGEDKVIDEAIHPQNSRNLPYMFDDLEVATAYEFKVRACSELTKLCGPWSDTVNGTTMDGQPGKVRDLKVVCLPADNSRGIGNSISVTWDLPEKQNGKVVLYTIQCNGYSTYRVEGLMKNVTWGPRTAERHEPQHQHTCDGVLPNTNYSVTVHATTRHKKSGERAQAFCEMPVAVPSNIGRSAWIKIRTDNERPIFKLNLPKISERNGPICCYRIYLVRLQKGETDLLSPENMNISTYHDVHASNNTMGGTYIAEMFPGDDFRTEVFLGDGKRIHLSEKDQTEDDNLCRKCLEGSDFRRVIIKVNKEVGISSTVKPDETSPLVSQREQLNRAGNLTQAASKILENKKRKRRHPRLGEIVVDETTTTSTTPTPAPVVVTAEKEDVFDGELDINSNYTGFLEVIIRDEKATDPSKKVLSAYSPFFETISPAVNPESEYKISEMDMILNIVLQVLCALVLLVSLLIAALCFMHRYYSKNTGQLDENISLRDSLSRALCGGRTSNHRHLIGTALAKTADIGPIQKADLPQAYKNRHRDTDYGFLREYEMLPNRFNDRTTKNSDMKENSTKNRYPDIKAYDQTRVKLSQLNGLQGSDYINANFVIGFRERKKFICAQGPMESTVSDFWRMIWEQHLEIIVMLTNLEEYNKAKCAKYWPEKVSDSKQFGDITVTFASEQKYSDYLIRNLDITRRNVEDEEDKRQITQYHYLVWKDFMAPEHPHGIIKFIRQINSVYSLQRGPILIHCSAGVGRTGTLVALDSLIQQLEEEGQCSIFQTVCDLRRQRNFLVQSLKQYIFLYRALLDIAQFGNTELQARNLSATIETLKQKPNDSREKCKLELEFEKIKALVEETNKSCAVGSGDENMSKNRTDLVIPFDRNRVILNPIPTREHSTYINASFIEGYDNSENFIITQDPMENTIGDFWRMVSEQSVTTIVMISEIGDGPRKCPRYWADDEIQYDHILVKYMQSESCPYYTRREFNVTNCKIDDTIKVTQFQYNGWPTVEGEVPEVCRGIIELVDQAQKHHAAENNFSIPTPIAVHCSLGTDRSSIFVAMCILVHQLRQERKIDICTTARKLRSQRTMLLDTYAQYEFLHRAIANYADLHKLSTDSPTDC